MSHSLVLFLCWFLCFDWSVVLSSARSVLYTVWVVRCDGNSLSGSDFDVWTSSKALLNLMMLLGGCLSFWSFSMMNFLSVPLVLSSVCSSVLYTVYVWCNGKGLSGSDLDAWTLSKALLNVMMLLGGCQSFWSISVSFLSGPVVLSSACSVLYTV